MAFVIVVFTHRIGGWQVSRTAGHGMRCSMSRKGNCWDHEAMESSSATLKVRLVKELDDVPHAKAGAGAGADVFQYGEDLHNPRRRHAGLEYLTPGQKRAAPHAPSGGICRAIVSA